MQAYPKKRLVVVIGAHHKPFLDIIFSRMKNVRVLKLGRDVPSPSADQIEKAWTTDDLLAVLGHNLDAGSRYFHAELVDLPRMRTIVAKLDHLPLWKPKWRPDLVAKLDSRTNLFRYFRARINILSGEMKKAQQDLDAILASKEEGDLYPFPMREWRMRYTLSEAVRLEKARIHLARDKHDQARAIIEPVIAALAFRVKMIEYTRPRELRKIQGINDPGFELGERASDIFAGWDTYLPTDAGKLKFIGDEIIKVEGARSLQIQVNAPNTKGYGFHLRQEISLPPTIKAGKMISFGLSLRGKGVSRARLEITHSFNSINRKPIASAITNLSQKDWVRSEVSFPLPEGGRFAIFIKFDGQKGAKLWLDNGAPLPVEYMTVPREWSRLMLACAYPKSLLQTGWKKSKPSVALKPVKTGLADPGFEKASLAKSPMGGWYCGYIPKFLQAHWDEAICCEGKRSLIVEVKEQRSTGRASIMQTVHLPDSISRGVEASFSMALRSNNKSTVLLQVGQWNESNRFEPLAQKEISLKKNKWERPTLRFRSPARARNIGIYVYLPSETGVRIWMDDARLKGGGGAGDVK